jgi:cytochrome c biogenesis protein CcmG/thiol:disulfide interchange protein DsbE
VSAEEREPDRTKTPADLPASGGLEGEAGSTRPKRSPPSWLSLALRTLAVGVVIGLVSLLVQRTLAQGEGPHLLAAIKADKKPLAPDFHLDVLWPRAETWPAALRGAIADGKVSARELRGHPIVLNFWASWCVPCKAEAPRLVASAQAHRGEVAFLGIDVQDFKSDGRKFLTRYDTNYVSVRDGGQTTYENYGLTGIPETYYLDARGHVVAHALGEVSRQELEAGIARAIEGSR